MGMKFVVPNVEETFGNLFFGSCVEEVHANRNENSAITKRIYSLFSEKQRADNILVELSKPSAKKNIGYDEPVELINPVIKAVPRRIGDNFFTEYIMSADDIKERK